MTTFGVPVVVANLGGNNQAITNLVVSNSENLGAVIGAEVGAGVDSLTGFTDSGAFTAMSSAAGGKFGRKVAERLTTRPENNPDRIRYYGDPISMFDFNAKSVVPSLEFRKDHSAHSYIGLSIPDKVPEHGVYHVPLTAQPSDSQARVLSE